MKTTMALKPLAFALAALMAVAAQAGQPNHYPQPAPTTASATTLDGQSNHGNVVTNEKPKTTRRPMVPTTTSVAWPTATC